MVALDIQQFSEVRTKARAYFCYLFSKNLPNRTPSISIENITGRLQKIKADLQDCEGVYVLDEKGFQVTPTYLSGKDRKEDDKGLSRASRAYYYRAIKESRCTITDPYPSLITQELTVTASQPIFDENGKVKYVACLDMPLGGVLKLAHPMAREGMYGKLFKFAYGAFVIALAMVALLLFVKGVQEFFMFGIDLHKIEVKGMFEATILLTLSLAIFDLSKTLFEEEVLGNHTKDKNHDIHHTMVRFLGSIIIALSIEALMLVFKFAMTAPEMLVNAIYIIGGVAMLLIGLAVYIKFTKIKVE
ncbi:MAG: PDC sensor domain-containing protein [Campylobacterota bacterium]|nr:PDC sensor domain-containing protein [Campylobacterota bacterium]